MKVKQFLCLLAIMSFIFSSCKKNDGDYRDKFEGTYETDVVGSVNLVDVGWNILSIDDNIDIVVSKFGTVQLMLIIGGEIEFVTVDEQGNFSIPPESGKIEDTDPDTGITLTLNLTITVTGNITNKTLYIKEAYSGDALIELEGEKILSKLTGAIVYNGKKI